MKEDVLKLTVSIAAVVDISSVIATKSGINEKCSMV
jgi:hypothetical protein